MLKTIFEGVFLAVTVAGLGVAGLNMTGKLQNSAPTITYQTFDMQVPLKLSDKALPVPSASPSPSASVIRIETDRLMLTKDNTLTLRGPIDDESASTLIAEAFKLDSKYKSDPIYLVLRTPGGSIDAGINIVNALRGLHRPVHTITLFAASMGFQTVQQLGTRYLTDTATLMSHRAFGGMQGEIGGSQPSSLVNRIRMVADIMDKFDTDTVARTSGRQTLDSYQKSYIAELWLIGKNAIVQGYADKLSVISCSDTGREVKTMNAGIFGKVEVSVSKCPLDGSIQLASGKYTDKEVEQIKNAISDMESPTGSYSSKF